MCCRESLLSVVVTATGLEDSTEVVCEEAGGWYDEDFAKGEDEAAPLVLCASELEAC
jgi:hypothetical protein